MDEGKRQVWHHPRVDQDLAAARANLRLTLPDVIAKLEAGNPVERVWLGLGQAMFRERDHANAALMFAAAVLTLAERTRTSGWPTSATWPHGSTWERLAKADESGATSGDRVELADLYGDAQPFRLVLAGYDAQETRWLAAQLGGTPDCEPMVWWITREMLHDSYAVRRL